MKKFILLSLIFLIAAFSCEQLTQENQTTQKKEREFDINIFVPSGYSIKMQISGNLNLDNIEDKILVLKPNGEDSLSTPETPLKRKFFILYGQSDKSYRVESKNENALYFYRYDANFHDALTDVSIQDGQFTISHYGGMAMRWGRTLVFKYHSLDKKFYLFSDEFDMFNANDEEMTTQSKMKTEKDLGKISFEQFDIYKE